MNNKINELLVESLAFRDKNTQGGRTDVNFDAVIAANSRELKAEIHLWRDMSFSRRAGWWASADCNTSLREYDRDYYPCANCSGNEGVSSPETPGLLAIAMAQALFPMLESQGYTVIRDKKTGWFLFEMRARLIGHPEDDQKGLPRFHIGWKTQIDCPVCGRHVQRDIEFAV